MKFMLAYTEFPMHSNVSASSEPIRVSKLPYIFRWIIFLLYYFLFHLALRKVPSRPASRYLSILIRFIYKT